MNELCKTLKSPKNRGRLREAGCEMSPKLNGHKWEALYCMLQTFFDVVGRYIEEIVRENASHNFGNEHSFTPTERATLLALKDDLGYFHSVSIALQSRDTNLYDVRLLFDRLLKRFVNIPELHHIRDDDKIVHYKHFSKGLVKLQAGKSQDPTEHEKIAMMPFLLRNGEGNDEEDDESSSEDDEDANGWAQRTLSKDKKQKTEKISEYISTKWIPCGTCEVERFFSTCKNIYSTLRQNMLPETMEILLYLRVNRKYWDIQVVQQVINKVNERVDDEGPDIN